jgi:subfamily B ATP-binding cassette protein MsbA
LFSTGLQLRINRTFQDRIFGHLLRLPMSELLQQPTGRLMSRVLDDGARFSAIFDQVFGRAVLEPVKLLLFTGLLIYLNIRLWSVMLVSTVISIYVIQWVGKKLHEISREIQKKDAAVYSFLQQMISNIELIKAKTTEARTASHFRGHLDQLIALSLRSHKISLVARPILQMLKYLAMGAVFVYGSWMISDGRFTVGTLTVFLGAAYLFFNAVDATGNIYGLLRENLARMAAVYAILDAPAESDTKKPVSLKQWPVKQITLDNVVFGYTVGRPVLKGVSFTIDRGCLFGVTGQSGSGKTTLIRLLLRFYRPDSGDILVNGRSVLAMNLAHLRASCGIVFQENLIFNDTIRANIAYGEDDLSDAQILKAAELSGARDFIETLPDGYETIVGEKGRRLSGGQRQRLAIARAIVSNPEILILDEGTSFLEVEQEAIILQNLKQQRCEKITIMVSHRLSAMKMADRTLVLDNGRRIAADYRHIGGAIISL